MADGSAPDCNYTGYTALHFALHFFFLDLDLYPTSTDQGASSAEHHEYYTVMQSNWGHCSDSIWYAS